MPNYLSVKQYADKIGLSVHAIRRMVQHGRIPGAKSVPLKGPARRNDHIWLIPEDAPYETFKRGRKKGFRFADRLAREYSDGSSGTIEA